MRSKPVNVRIPWPLYEALKETCKSRGFDHLHACILGACIMMVQNERRKSWVPSIANSSPRDQDFMLRVMLNFPTDKPTMLKVLKQIDT